MNSTQSPLPRKSAGSAEHPRCQPYQWQAAGSVVSDLSLHTLVVRGVGAHAPYLDVPAVCKEVGTAPRQARDNGLNLVIDPTQREPVINTSFVDRPNGMSVDAFEHPASPPTLAAMDTSAIHDRIDGASRDTVYLADGHDAHSLIDVELFDGGGIGHRHDFSIASSHPSVRPGQPIAVKPRVYQSLGNAVHLRNISVRVMLDVNQSIQCFFIWAKASLNTIFESGWARINAESIHPSSHLRLGHAVERANVASGHALSHVEVGKDRRKGAGIPHGVTSRRDDSRQMMGQGYREISGSNRVIRPILALPHYTSLEGAQ